MRTPFFSSILAAAKPRAAVAVVAVGVSVVGAGCSRLVPVDLTLAEPCGQENQALNGVSSFRIVSSGAEPDGVTAFTADQSQPMSVGLGDKVVVSVEAYADDITVGADPNAPTVLPKSVGRTMPLSIGEKTAAVEGVVLVGKTDSFGAPRSVDGTCPQMTEGASIVGRHGHTATYIPGVNKVLLFGGAVWNADGSESFLKSAEVFDPATGTFSALPEATNARAYHTATALPDGKVLIVGGFSVIEGNLAPIRTALLIDVNAADPYVKPILLRIPRAHHTATLLPDVGLLAIIGGCTGFSAADGCAPDRASGGSTAALTPSIEYLNINDIGDETLAAAGSLSVGRAMHTAVGFASGQTGYIAIAGGVNGTGALNTMEIVRVGSGSFTDGVPTRGNLPNAMVRHQMVVSATNQIVLTGGQTDAPGGILSATAPASAKATVCDLTDGAGSCDQLADMTTTRYGHAMVKLRTGALLVVGGVTPSGAGAELFRLRPGASAQTWAPTTGPLAVSRDRAAVALLGGDTAADGFVNQIFYSGGFTTDGTTKTTSALSDIYFGD
jgi:hypothetical protein